MVISLMAVTLHSQNSLKPVQLNVFKNGNYFIAKEGSIPVKKGIAVVELPEKPLLGTYWMNPAKDNKISKVCFITDTIKKTKRPEILQDIFKGSVGKKVRFSYFAGSDKNLREINGTLAEYYEFSSIAKIRLSDGKTTYFPVSSVVEFTIDETGAGMLTIDSLVRVAKIYPEKTASNFDLKLVYMQSGIQWFPSYNVKLINENELQLEMKALVENYAEEIENVDLTLTVGNPQFFYAGQLDPISSNYLTSIYDTRTSFSTSIPLQAQSYINDNSFVSFDRSENVNFEQFNEFNTEGEKTNDLYMYKIGNASLPMKSKNSFQIFSTKIPYKDVYDVKIGDVVNYSYYSYINNDPEKRFDVFHSIKLTNVTTYPFTTAPAFIMNENLQPLAQDKLKYTPTGASVSLQLAKAGDVVVKNKEEEIKKEDAVKKIGKNVYNRVTIKGTIFVENLQNKKITLTLTKSLTANVISASNDGKIEKSGRYINLNPYVDINWEIPFGAKEKKSITYEYEVLVPTRGEN